MARGQTDYGPSRRRSCRMCGMEFVHHFFTICEECRPDVTDRDAAFIPTEEEIAEGCLKIRDEWSEEEELKRRESGRRKEAGLRVYKARAIAEGSGESLVRVTVWDQVNMV